MLALQLAVITTLSETLLLHADQNLLGCLKYS